MKSVTIRLKTAAKNTFGTLMMVMPMLLAVIALAGLFQTLVTPEMIQSVFKGSLVQDTLIGTGIGATSVGQPFLSYVIGGELLHEGVSLYAVTAFILSFVTLGVIQLPLEWSLFGTRFTLLRNSLSFIFAFLDLYCYGDYFRFFSMNQVKKRKRPKSRSGLVMLAVVGCMYLLTFYFNPQAGYNALLAAFEILKMIIPIVTGGIFPYGIVTYFYRRKEYLQTYWRAEWCKRVDDCSGWRNFKSWSCVCLVPYDL